MGNSHDAAEPEKSLLVYFVAAHQVLVIAKVAQEPAEFPQSFGSAIEAAGEGTALLFAWFKDDELQDVEGPLRMPTVEDAVDADQERACNLPF